MQYVHKTTISQTCLHSINCNLSHIIVKDSEFWMTHTKTQLVLFGEITYTAESLLNILGRQHID